MSEDFHKTMMKPGSAAVQDLARRAAMDELIRLDVLNALYWDPAVPRKSVNVEVRDGQVRLTGEVVRAFSAACAERDAQATTGVIGVTNAIVIVGSEQPGASLIMPTPP